MVVDTDTRGAAPHGGSTSAGNGRQGDVGEAPPQRRVGRDRTGDPRVEARNGLDAGTPTHALVWGLIHIGDALHRVAKALELDHDPEEVERHRHTAARRAA